MHSISNRRTKLLLISLPISAILIFFTLFSLFSSSTLTNNVTKPESETEKFFNSRASIPHIHVHQNYQIAQSACTGTRFSDLCVSTLLTIPNLRGKLLSEIITAAVNLTVAEAVASEKNCTRIRRKIQNLQPIDRRALEDCLELLDDTISELEVAGKDLGDRKLVPAKYHHLQTLLSGAMTNQATCLDGFAHSKGQIRHFIEDRLETISHHVSNILAMLKKLPGEMGFAAEGDGGYGIRGGFPTWVSGKERRLLQAAVNETRVDLVVAKDGSGDFTTVGAAVEAAPNSSATRFVIRIKSGAYFENLEVPKKKTNLMFVGDGIGKTYIKGNRSVVDGWTTFRSATVAVVGNGFIAKGITFENYAGPSKHQAVALRSGSDFSAFYQCSFVGYQDTLYVHSLRQFYRECDVYGTVDFIFGNAAVVFQNCNLYARKPNENQKNIFTAQGREDPNQNTGISILNSKVAAAVDLIPVQSTFKNYLGRPWKEYSRTVFLSSNIGDLIDRAGWLEWSGEFALSTLFYGEYNNRGSGSNMSARVTWPGYRASLNASEATKFTVGHFIQGKEWLPSYNIVPFYLNLTG